MFLGWGRFTLPDIKYWGWICLGRAISIGQVDWALLKAFALKSEAFNSSIKFTKSYRKGILFPSVQINLSEAQGKN